MPRVDDIGSPVGAGIRPPQQRRSRESLERVLKAGEELLAAKGYEGFTIAEVSRAASVSVGSVYGRFESKDALIYAIHRRLGERVRRSVRHAADDGTSLDPYQMVAKEVREFADSIDSERALVRVFMLRAAVDPQIAKQTLESGAAARRAFRAAMLARRSEIGHPDPEVAVDIAYYMISDVLLKHVTGGPLIEHDDLRRPWNVLVDELSRVLVAYLRYADD